MAFSASLLGRAFRHFSSTLLIGRLTTNSLAAHSIWDGDVCSNSSAPRFEVSVDQVCWSCAAAAGEDSLADCDTLRTSCRSRYADTAKRTRSFKRKATVSVIAGNPPAEAAQPFGINGIIVMVEMNEKTPPSAPRIPNFLFQNPAKSSAPKNHSATPKNQQAPRMPKTGYIQEIRGPLLIYGINACAS